MSEKIAFFDVDHTLLRRASAEYFLREAWRRKIVPLRLILAIPALYFSYRFQKVRWDMWDSPLPGIAGIPDSTLHEIAVSSFNKRYLPALFPAMERQIAQLREEGTRIWLATSSVDIIVKPLAEYFGADGIIASSLEFSDGKSTGRFAGKPVFGPEKLNRVRDLAFSRGIDLSCCSFFSDSIHDLPLLEAAGRPVAVNPDFKLARIAKKRGWQIVRC
jgi:HAD superfamily hydrolase (TIGR01490 family)